MKKLENLSAEEVENTDQQYSIERLVKAERFAKSYINKLKSRYDRLKTVVNSQVKLFVAEHQTTISNTIKKISPQALRSQEYKDMIDYILEEIDMLESYKHEAYDELFDFIYIGAWLESSYDLSRMYDLQVDTNDLPLVIPTKTFEDKTYEDRIDSDENNLSYKIPYLIKKALSIGIVNDAYQSESVLAAIDQSFKSNVDTLVQTYTNAYFNAAVISSYQDAGVATYVYNAILDAVTTEICEDLNGNIFRVEDAEPFVNLPPMHYNCRSTIYPSNSQSVTVSLTFEDYIKKFGDLLSTSQLEVVMRYYLS